MFPIFFKAKIATDSDEASYFEKDDGQMEANRYQEDEDEMKPDEDPDDNEDNAKDLQGDIFFFVLESPEGKCSSSLAFQWHVCERGYNLQ